MYYIGIFFSTLFGIYAKLKIGRRSNTLFDLFMYSFVTGCIASLFFFCMSGFRISVNLPVLIYSAIFAVIVILSHFLGLFVYKFLEVSAVTVLSNTFTLILTVAAGRAFLGEPVDVFDIIRCLLLVVACIIPDIPMKKTQKQKSSVSVAGIVTVLLSSAISVIASVLANRFSSDVRVTDSNSFFFMTNIFVIAFSAGFVIARAKFNFSSIKKQFLSFSGKSLAMTVVSTVSSNLGSIFQVLIFASGDGIILYTPLAAALGFIAAGIIAIAEKERPRILSLALACGAAFLSLL